MKKLGFGTMRLPLKDKNDQTSIDMDTFKQMVDLFLDRGFTYFDTAYMYHEFKSETAVREALVERYPRDAFLLATKLPVMFLKQEGDQQRIFDEQREKCGVDYFDYYMLHNIGAEHYEIAKRFDSFGFIQAKKEEGKVRNIGFSYHDDAKLLDEILTAHPEVDFVQLQINYLDWDNESIQSGRCYEVTKTHGKKVIVMEPVKGGTLARIPKEAEAVLRRCTPDMTAASWAIRFAASLDEVLTVLSGMSDLQQMEENTGYMQQFEPLSEKEKGAVREVVDMINRAIAIPCTACRYCVDGCPKHIPIPDYFALYNTEKVSLNANRSAQSVYYENYARTMGKASECIACRKCEKSCPQHIEIADKMKGIAEMFEK